MVENTPFTYIIGWTSKNKWYYGVRYSKNAHPSDLWTIYFTSSNEVSKYRKEYGEPDVIEIRKIFKCGQDARNWEHKVLRRLKVETNENFINLISAYPPIFNKNTIRTYYDPMSGAVYQMVGTYKKLNKKHVKINNPANDFPFSFGSSVLREYRIRINNNIQNIIWDNRFDIPDGWNIGYYLSPLRQKTSEISAKKSRGSKRNSPSEETRKKMSDSHWTKSNRFKHGMLGKTHDIKTRKMLSEKKSKYTYTVISPAGFIFDDIKSIRLFCKEMNLSDHGFQKFANSDTPIDFEKSNGAKSRASQKFYNSIGWLSFRIAS